MKFITVFLFVIMSTLSAMALPPAITDRDDWKPDECYKIEDNSSIKVWFNFGKKDLNDKTDSCKAELKQKVKDALAKLTCPAVDLLGSADKVKPENNSVNNMAFAEGRVKWVENNILSGENVVILKRAYQADYQDDNSTPEKELRYVKITFKEIEEEDRATYCPESRQAEEVNVSSSVATAKVTVDNRSMLITSAMSAIKDMEEKTDSFKENKWKNAEGRFNAARLASDSIAGVVLGTAGGLITSTVVKKTQIKKGFEDISCTIGGQTVADWGDEFTVGVK